MPKTAAKSKKAKVVLDATEKALIEDIAAFYDDPLGYVLYVFPWGEPGTQLVDADGPDDWQREFLEDLGARIQAGEATTDAIGEALRFATSSGHGIGKSAMVAWLIKWFMATRENPQVVVTANTEKQLSTKTWRELSKWNKLALDGHWFDWTATKFYHREYPETWVANAIPWSEHNSEAFAGTHEKHVLLIFDEASAIADIIWEVAEGAMTTAGAIWVCFGNPTKNSGRFHACFGSQKHRWVTRQIDSRTCKMTNKAQIAEWLEDYGEDSDFFRVRVRGVFPRAGSSQLIAGDMVFTARKRSIDENQLGNVAKIMAADIARHGDDETVVTLRKGLKVFWQVRWRIPDTQEIADRLAELMDEHLPDACFIDATGLGWGVYDAMKRRKYSVIGVQVGETARDERTYHNKRAEIWCKMRDWFKEGPDIPDDNELEADLTGLEYGHDNKDRVQLEKKEDMKKRGLSSPDGGDSLALTFAAHVNPAASKGRTIVRRRPTNWRTT